jgi:hypothetical protein
MAIVPGQGPSTAFYGGQVDGPYFLYVQNPSGFSGVGSTVTINVLAYSNGALADPDDVHLRITNSSRIVPLTRESVGRYRGDVIIHPEDIGSGGDVSISARGNFSSSRIHPTELAYIKNIETSSTDTVFQDIVVPDPLDERPVPGQTVEFELWLRNGGVPLDVPASDMWVAMSEDPHVSGSNKMNVTRIGPGRFSGQFVVPHDLKSSTYYWISTGVEVGGVSHGSTKCVARVVFFNIWTHALSVDTESSTVEVYVTDRENRPIEGALLRIDHFLEAELEGIVTDEGGRATTIISTGEIWGNASFEGYTQEFMAYIDAPSKHSDSRPDVPSLRLVTQMPLPEGEHAVLEYILSNSTTVFPDCTSCFYIYDSEGIYWTGKATTDADGRIVIAIDTPTVRAGQAYHVIHIQYMYSLGTGWYASFDDLIVVPRAGWVYWPEYSEPGLRVECTALAPGQEATVRIFGGEVDGVDEIASVRWGLGLDYEGIPEGLVYHGLIPSPQLAEGCWSTPFQAEKCGMGMSNAPPFTVACEWDDGVYVAHFKVPDFLPVNMSICVRATVIYTDTMETSISMANKPPADQYVEPEVSQATPLMYLLTLVIIGSISTSVLWYRRKIMRRESEGLGHPVRRKVRDS